MPASYSNPGLCDNPAVMNLRMLTLVLSLLLLAPTLTAQTAPSEDPKEVAKQARQLSEQGKPDEALALFKKALAASPDLYDAHLGAGVALDLKGQYAEARKHLGRAVELASADQKGRALRTMAMSFAFEGNTAEAARFEKQVFDSLLAAGNFTGAAGIANELARVYLESGSDLDNAAQWYRTGYDTALRKKDMKGTERALWDFRWEHAQARIAARRGQKEQAQKHVAAARTALDQAMQDKENAGQAQYLPYLTGYVAFYGGNHKQAIADFAKADPEDPFMLVMLAQAHEKSGDAAKAKELYQKALQAGDHGPNAAYARPLAQKKLAGK